MLRSYALPFLLVLVVCSVAAKQGPLKRTYTLSGFSSVVVSGPIEATIEIGEVGEVIAQANYQWLLDKMSIKKKGKVLQVKLEGGINLSSSNDMPRVTIVTDKLTGIQALNTASVTVEGSPPKVTKFTGVSSKVSSLTLPSMEADTFYLTASDVSTLRISGKSTKSIVVATDMGTIDGDGLTCRTAYINADKMSNVKLRVEDFATATANQMSNIHVSGPARV